MPSLRDSFGEEVTVCAPYYKHAIPLGFKNEQ